jgi:CheY-like chemotaxis protein
MLEKGDRLNVILVDDDADDRMLFEEAFSELKIESALFLFQNGLELLNYLYSPETAVPDLIFLDLNMPIMGGMETLENIKRSEKYANVPLAIYSTSSHERDIEDTLARGANIYITKPTDYNKLKKTLDEVLKIQWQYSTSHLRLENFVMVIE